MPAGIAVAPSSAAQNAFLETFISTLPNRQLRAALGRLTDGAADYGVVRKNIFGGRWHRNDPTIRVCANGLMGKVRKASGRLGEAPCA
ncbi:hypothetical protein Q9Q95_14170 [Sphingomonas sp. DG1-23]|uniref:hypothetical protein n=1 Tax=Sphingomonas sp. DG1-23 TaxID=3068316 RepID=UPI00273DE2A7|nr:hypothetical protein [Sphingomonas sp. DG1-23]MDP5280073.1 hypothetical protein [Sphingomonas sp. DG1-23]